MVRDGISYKPQEQLIKQQGESSDMLETMAVYFYVTRDTNQTQWKYQNG